MHIQEEGKPDTIAERVRSIIEDHRNHTENHMIDVGGIRLVIYPGVFDPSRGSISREVIKYLDVKEGQQVLDVGTGCSIYAIIMAKKGANVVAVDFDKNALDCARDNVKRHRLQDRIKVIKSNVFAHVPNRRYDLIVANPPIVDFRHYKQDFSNPDSIERALLDDETFIRKFLRNAYCFLKGDGRAIIAYANTGFTDLFDHLVQEQRYNSRVLEEINHPPEVFYIHELKR